MGQSKLGVALVFLKGLALSLILMGGIGSSGCGSLFFWPEQQHLQTPADLGLEYEDVTLTTNDGVDVHAWYIPAEQAQGTVLFLHGNAENISTHMNGVAWLALKRWNLLLLDYRGYGRSSGEAGIEGAHQDALAAIDYLATRQAGQPVVVFGQSLGGSIAISAVARSPHKPALAGLITESAFSDYRGIAREKLSTSWLTWPFQYPLSWLIPGDFSPLEDVARISPLPLVVMHSRTDTVVGFQHGERLYAAAQEPKQLWPVSQAPHAAALMLRPWRGRFLEQLNSWAARYNAKLAAR